MNIEANCDIVFSQQNLTAIKLTLPGGYEDALSVLHEGLDKKRVSQVYVKLGMPRKPRTTGDKSQNHALNGFIQQLCQESGDEFDDMKKEIKRRAIKRGYPFHTDSFGNVVPQSEADCSTVECAMLIDEAHDVASFLNVKLKET